MRDIKDIPNKDGYRFTGFTKRGAIPFVVSRDSAGLHHATSVDGAEKYRDLMGWETHAETKLRWQACFDKAKQKDAV
jgi:hypothetical protein